MSPDVTDDIGNMGVVDDYSRDDDADNDYEDDSDTDVIEYRGNSSPRLKLPGFYDWITGNSRMIYTILRFSLHPIGF